MIRIQVSAVLAVRDGFSGKPIGQSTVRCFLDGMPYRPQYRNGGYLVFVNLEPGAHEVRLQGAYYQDEKLTLEIQQEKREERSITLKPAANYPFYSAVTRLAGALVVQGKPVENRILWVAAKTQTEELKLAQDTAEAGDQTVKLFYRGGREENRFPRNYLIVDGKKSEVVPITGAQEGQAALDVPLKYQHKRGVAFYPAQAYCTGAQGEILAFFREAVPVEVFDPERKTLTSLVLQPGRNDITF